MNAEQIIKALECCIEGECDGCTYDEQTACKEYILHDALALITSQEQRIKELTEENERLLARNFDLAEKGEKVVIAYKKLSEENERLRERNVALEQKLIILGCDEQYIFKAQVKGE
jgi:hypothetical protein